jgi:hypothetical protein
MVIEALVECRRDRRFAVVLLAVAVAGCSRCSDREKITPVHESVSGSSTSPPVDEDLGATIDLAISMLKQKQYRAFLERFIAPIDRPKLLKDGGIDELLPAFANSKAKDLLVMLTSIRNAKPRMEGDEAVFVTETKDIHWVLDHGKWYIRN